MRYCSTSCSAPTRPSPTPPAGTAPLWSGRTPGRPPQPPNNGGSPGAGSPRATDHGRGPSVLVWVVVGVGARTGPFGALSAAGLAGVAAAVLMLAQLDGGVAPRQPQLGRERRVVRAEVGDEVSRAWPGHSRLLPAGRCLATRQDVPQGAF